MFSIHDSHRIVSDLRVSVHASIVARLHRIDNEDFRGTAKKVREHMSAIGSPVHDDYIVRGIFALKQYYAIALLDPANAHAVSRPIDPFWHSHLLHSELYQEFCDEVVGEYMHHRPLDHDNREHVAVIRRLYEYTVDVLPQVFKTIDPEFWPRKVSNADLICWHKGNQTIYLAVQPHRLFEPTSRGVGYAV
jgi:hypothetical protein